MALALWYSCMLLEALLLFRAVTSPLWRTYPLFCFYIACTLAGDVALFVIFRTASDKIYQYSYWAKEFICVLAGYCLVLEILEKTLAAYEGPKKLARNAGFVLFTLVVGITTGRWLFERGSHLFTTSVEVERNLRGAELVLLALVIGAVLYYDLPIGKNLKGITIGYGTWVGTVVIDRAIQSFAPSYRSFFSRLLPISYLASLIIWVVSLWSYQPNVAAEGPKLLTEDYRTLTNRTRGAINGMRGHLGKAAQ